MKRLFLFIILFLLAAGAGVLLANSPRQPTAYDLERSSMNLEFARTLQPFRIAFRVLLGAIVLLTVAGLGWSGVRWLHRRADTVYPDQAGLYPLREGRIGGAKVFHDPNRALAGSTLYAAGPSTVEVRHAVPEGQTYAQQQVTTQAQATQALRAAVSGSAPLPSGEHLPIGALSSRRVSRPLPEVRSLELEPTHIERLLLEDSGRED